MATITIKNIPDPTYNTLKQIAAENHRSINCEIINFYLSSEYSVMAEKLFLKNPAWAAPFLWRSEFRNVLSSYTRKQIITLHDAMQIFETAESLLQGSEHEVNSNQVLKLSQESGCSAYDCEFVNLAQDLNEPHVTLDKTLLDNFKKTALSIHDYLDKY